MKKIGYLIPQFPGQTHIFFWREMEELKALGVEPVVFSTRPPPRGLIAHDWSALAMSKTTYLGTSNPMDLVFAAAKFPLASIWQSIMTEGHAFWRDLMICLPAARRLAHECENRGISHVHVHSCGRAALIAALANRMYGLSYSLTLHGPLPDYGPGQSFKWRHAAFATIITEKLLGEMKRDLAEDLPQRLTIQPMGVDTDVFQRSAPYVPPASGETIRLFSCGRLNVVKGHQDLMQAVRILLDRGVNVSLEIAGEDDDGGHGYRAVLEEEIRTLRLQDHVRLLGAIDAGSVRDHLTSAHVFVLASWHEPLGVALMEAMSCGTPTIGTNSGGVPELIQDGVNGLMAPAKSPLALAEVIGALINNPEKCKALSQTGRQHIVAGFRASRGARTILDMAREAMN